MTIPNIDNTKFGNQMSMLPFPVKNSYADLNCDRYCPISNQDFLHVMEYKDDKWINLGTWLEIGQNNRHERLPTKFLAHEIRVKIIL